jgi:uncharacterized protein
MFVVDTNLLLYAVNTGAREHRRSRELLDGWCADRLPWFVTWGILYEFLRVATHPAVFPHPLSPERAWAFVSALLDSSSAGVLTETPRHREVASWLWEQTRDLRGNLVHDAHVATLMREHGVSRIYTHDNDFRRFQFLEIVDPLAR